MMLNYHKTINNVRKMIPFNNGMLYSDLENKVYFNESRILDNVDGASIFLINTDIAQVYDLENGCYYYRDGSIIKSDYFIKCYNDSSKIIAQSSARRISRGVYERDVVILSENLIDIDNKLLSDIKFNILECTDDFLIIGNKSQIHAYTLPSAQPLWQFDLGSLGSYKNIINEIKTYEVKHFLGMHDGVLLVQLSNATFLFLDGKTGVLKHKVCLNESYALPNPVFYDDAFKAHLADGKLILLNNQRLLEINLTSYAVRIIRNYYQEPRENQYRFMQSTYFDGNIYFVADFGWQYVTPSYIGVMEAKTGEILWKLQLENTGGLSEAPQVTKDRLYIRTNNNVLHIFEKET